MSFSNHNTNPKLNNQLQSNYVLVYINTFVVAHQWGWVSLREKETFFPSMYFSLYRSGLAVSQSHPIWPGFHGWIPYAHTQCHYSAVRCNEQGDVTPDLYLSGTNLSLILWSVCCQSCVEIIWSVALVTTSVSMGNIMWPCDVLSQYFQDRSAYIKQFDKTN